ncbi:uncharacterized protein [Oscarella lobularis]|uniref:uncharacterized protein n=1 Tax=Oscarella lobularis TaxID=121494 RepID=UPI0033143B63
MFPSSQCANESVFVRFPSPNTSQQFFSWLTYKSVTNRWISLTVCIMCALSVICNAAVIAWRCKQRRGSIVSFLIVNLAVADCAIAAAKMFFLAALLTSNSWCQAVDTVLSSLCFIGYLIFHLSSKMNSLILVTVALVELKELCNCFSIRQDIMKFLIISLVCLEWLLMALYTGFTAKRYFDELFTDENNKTINWNSCWSASTDGPYGTHKTSDVLFISVSSSLVFLSIIAYAVILIHLFRKRRHLSVETERNERFYNQLRFRLSVIMLVNGILILFLFAWDGYAMSHRENYSSFADNRNVRALYTATIITVPLISLVNPFLYTFFSKSFLRKLSQLIHMRCCKVRSRSFARDTSRTSLVDEQTALFTESSRSTTLY